MPQVEIVYCAQVVWLVLVVVEFLTHLSRPMKFHSSSTCIFFLDDLWSLLVQINQILVWMYLSVFCTNIWESVVCTYIIFFTSYCCYAIVRTWFYYYDDYYYYY